LGEIEAKTVKKPSLNRSANDRRNTLFRVLDGVLSLSHRKIHSEGNSGKAGVGTGIGFRSLNLWRHTQGRGAGAKGVRARREAQEQHTDSETARRHQKG
jgi:hypothetical protein